MAVENLGKCITVAAGSDLSGSQWGGVIINSSGQLELVGAGDDADGILQDKPAAAGRAGSIMLNAGVSFVKAGASASLGDSGAFDSSGRMVTATSGDKVQGKFLEAPGAANQVVTFLFDRKGTL